MGKFGKTKGKGLSAAKAGQMLEDGTAQGKPLTSKQKGFFGAVAGGMGPKMGSSARMKAGMKALKKGAAF